MKRKRITVKTRKPVNHLRPADFSLFPIWEYALDEEGVDGQDETWVRPLDAKTIRMGLWSLSAVAKFELPIGIKIPGFMGVTTAKVVDIEGAVLLPRRKYVCIHTNKNNSKSRRAAADALGLHVKAVFPMIFTLGILIGRESTPRQGIIE